MITYDTPYSFYYCLVITEMLTITQSIEYSFPVLRDTSCLVVRTHKYSTVEFVEFMRNLRSQPKVSRELRSSRKCCE